MVNFEETLSQVRKYVAGLDIAAIPFVSERAIADEFNINRSNARKILLQLEGEGLLECLPKRGYRKVDYSQTTMRTFYNIRIALEGEAVRLAAVRAKREDILRLMLILDECETVIAEERYDEFPALDEEFHRALVLASRDAYLKKFVGLLVISNARDTVSQVPPKLIKGAHNTHKEVFEALRKKDGELACKLLREKHFGSHDIDDLPYVPEKKTSNNIQG